ncbi:DUF4383 domain-containing protein [Amycolatopsis sp. DSM 110486]|uniref:DUF4383 domain-containing protein n=1 Tax=Amycolatopsis sp. DSM 110486 TaxID=2865832 RepID=UPI001C69B798|nr:DUF4383 domain-containing protein [Amycolatopsis sp. DSM 110486]QYN19093.1 DUF4383 domain-containing protein [Amycolatopsis sp. DSM 110486]
MTSTKTAVRRGPRQLIAAVVGAVFLAVGVLGFIPGVTTHYDQLSWAGHDSGALLLGVFAVSVLHNIVHLAFGVAGLALSGTARGARGFLLGGGVIYLVLWLYGLIIDHGSAANFVPVNTSDDWLHLGLGVGMIVLGLIPLPKGTHL